MAAAECSAQTAIKSFVAGKFPNLQFWFIGCHIPKQSFLLSGSLYKFKTALRTGNAYSALSAGNSDFLFTGRTFVNMKILKLQKVTLFSFKKSGDPSGIFQVLYIFRITAAVIFGEHPVVAQDDQ